MLGFRTGRLVPAVAAAGIAALALAAVAAADREQVRLTAAGQSAARAAVLQRADLGGASGWTGGAKKPDISSRFPCASYQPKQSDLVLNGAAETVWHHAGVELDSEAQVLATPAMVGLDWQRSVLAPPVVPCLRAALAKQLAGSGKLVAFARLAFPQLATYTRAYRALVDVAAGGTTVRVLVDVVLLGRGRTELTLMTTAPFAAASSVTAAERQLARVLVSRIRL